VSVDTRLAVLKVLGGQSPDYFAFPNASAFAAEGLDAVEVAAVLEELYAEGKLERETFVVEATDPANDGGGEQLPGGYRLKPESPEKGEDQGA
jgi:hypothetical protein